MGLSIDYLYSLTPRQFANIQDGWNANIEMQTKTSWEQVRTLYDAVIRPHLKSKNKSAKEILPFPWDKEDARASEENPEKTSEEMEERWEKIDKMKKESIGKL
ncbi:hypothetical protein [Myroides odoratimimus]|uniref:hypothetical protein n=1 Tax=Myroides odoratimimus TaxID=76832 RepID=UPI0029C07D28|nr:hypothetical protein [Myroides odoratimimus]MDX4973713.1 hypothetical protein [Myroides odoratimimus]